ncbi:MAG: PHP domain-containing protein [bacterium]
MNNDFTKILSSLSENDYYENANFHIHSTCSDGLLSPEAIIKNAVKLNLKYISITDHNTLDAYKSFDCFNQANLQVITGVEFDCWHKGTLLHILGYGVDINNKELNSLCGKKNIEKRADVVRFFNQRGAKQVIDFIKKAGGTAILAHPGCTLRIGFKHFVKELKSYGLDGLEVYYPYKNYKKLINIHNRKKLLELCKGLDLYASGGSDCHGIDLRLR